MKNNVKYIHRMKKSFLTRWNFGRQNKHITTISAVPVQEAAIVQIEKAHATMMKIQRRARANLLVSSSSTTRTLGWLAAASKSAALALALSSTAVSSNKKVVLNLQLPFSQRSPSKTLQDLSEDCTALGIDKFDVYGDFDQSPETSFLKEFEATVANELGMEDAVFMPSGGMAQSIALLIHQQQNHPSHNGKNKENTQSSPKKSYFVCHHTSHLLLHEQDAYRELLYLEPIVVSTVKKAKGLSIPPMMLEDVVEAVAQQHDDGGEICTLMLELPHREIGGKLTPWSEVVKLKDYCHEHGTRFHLDGARIFEASTGYEDKSLQEIAQVFDSVYISFYKGLGGISGAMLLGSTDFCNQARVWLRRFGGNLYTLLPYAASGWAGYTRQWKLQQQGETSSSEPLLSFEQKKEKLVGLVAAMTKDESISKVVAFDPPVPETNMVHGYIRDASPEDCTKVLEAVQEQTGIRVLSRARPVSENEPAYQLGYRSKFEWPMGEANGGIPDDAFLRGWKEFSKSLMNNKATSASQSTHER